MTGEAGIKAMKVADLRLSFRRHSSESWNPCLQGCRAFGELSRAVVEPRLEQAAEEGDGGVLRETLIQSELPQ